MIPATTPLCACGHPHRAGIDGEDSGCSNADCACWTWRGVAPSADPLRAEVERLATEWEKQERIERELYRRCVQHGDEVALDTARLARARSKVYRDCAAALRVVK